MVRKKKMVDLSGEFLISTRTVKEAEGRRPLRAAIARPLTLWMP